MTHRTLNIRIRPTHIAALAGAALTLGFATGCGDGEEAQAAVKEAGRSFTAIAAGDPNAVPSYSQTKYSQTEQNLSKYAGDENGFAEAAAVGVALSKKGQAALASMEAVRAESEALRKARIIRGYINEWLTMNAIALAADQFDPTDDITEIEQIIELRKEDISHYQQQMNEINAEIADLEAQISALRERASEQRNRAGELELQMPRVSAQKAADLAQQVREFTLRADQFELEATRIDGVVGQLRPGAREISLNVDKARSQVELLEEAAAEQREREQQSQRDAREAREMAQQAAQRIREAVNEYQAYRDDEVQSINDKAMSLVRSAISATRDARNAVQRVASINKADAQQMLAAFAMRQAAGEREEAMLYMALQDTGVSGDWDARIQAANQQADEYEQIGQQSYLDAASSLRAARIRGDAAERIEAAANRLEVLGGMEPEPEPDMPMDEPGDEDTAPDDALGMNLSEMTLEEILEMVPEDMRDSVAQQFQSMMDMLESTDDPEMLRDMIAQLDEQADGMPAEVAEGFEWVKLQIQNRIDELESDG